MSNLSTVGAFALRAGWFPAAASFAWRIACRAAECAFLLFASKATFLVAVETAEFGFETGGELVGVDAESREDNGDLQSLVAGVDFGIAGWLQGFESGV